MSEQPEHDAAHGTELPTAPTAKPATHRTRWQRFSPAMGWSAFWSEILIVVLGVVIALAASEAVEDWNWQRKVDDAESRLKGDLAWVFLWSAEKSVSQPCIDAQLASLSARLLGDGDRLEPAPVVTTNLNIPYVVRFPFRPYRFPMWDALLADGTATRFPQRRQELLGRISDGVGRAGLAEEDIRRMAGRLVIMRDPIALDAVVRANLLTDIAQLRALYAQEAVFAKQHMRLIADAGDAPPDSVVESFLNAAGKNPSGSDFSGIPSFCASRELPVGDWRDYVQVSISLGAPLGMAPAP